MASPRLWKSPWLCVHCTLSRGVASGAVCRSERSRRRSLTFARQTSPRTLNSGAGAPGFLLMSLSRSLSRSATASGSTSVAIRAAASHTYHATPVHMDSRRAYLWEKDHRSDAPVSALTTKKSPHTTKGSRKERGSLLVLAQPGITAKTRDSGTSYAVCLAMYSLAFASVRS